MLCRRSNVIQRGGEVPRAQKQGGRVMHKRDMTLIDDSNTEVRLTLWGDQARASDDQWRDHAIVACKSLKVT